MLSFLYFCDRSKATNQWIRKKINAAVLLDNGKALDSITHCMPLSKLQGIGTPSSGISWFEKYLSQRLHVMRINSMLSDKLPVVSSVSQGSFLGPVLFSIYINDLPTINKFCSSVCYVDDTKLTLLFCVKDSNSAIAGINSDLILIRNWCIDNCPLLNPDKTKLKVFGTHQMLRKLRIFKFFLLGKDLVPIDSFKDLGIIF